MASAKPKSFKAWAQEHVLICEEHTLHIDITCEDCEKFICSKCAKTDHRDHDWNTIATAAILIRRDLTNRLCKIDDEYVKEIYEEIQKVSMQIDENQICFDSDISNLNEQFLSIFSKLHDIKKEYEKLLKENFERKQEESKKVKSNLERKHKELIKLVNFIEEKHSTMSDLSLIDNLRDLTKLINNRENNIGLQKENHLVRYNYGHIRDDLLKSMMGHAFCSENIALTETDSFKHSDESILDCEVLDEDTFLVLELNHIERVKKGERERFNQDATCLCVSNNGDVYITSEKKNSILKLSTSGLASPMFSTAPLKPEGICQSIKDGLFITLIDDDSEIYHLEWHSRRLVRQVTMSGVVIREYEYHEDGHTRLFTLPVRIKQNGNTDICVLNWTSDDSSELVILSSSGCLKSVYQGLNKCSLTDVVCDAYFNILISDMEYSQIHILSADGKFLKYLLKENEVYRPFSLSMYDSTLWVGDNYGTVKVFHYETRQLRPTHT